ALRAPARSAGTIRPSTDASAKRSENAATTPDSAGYGNRCVGTCRAINAPSYPAIAEACSRPPSRCSDVARTHTAPPGANTHSRPPAPSVTTTSDAEADSEVDPVNERWRTSDAPAAAGTVIVSVPEYVMDDAPTANDAALCRTCDGDGDAL